MRQQHLVHLVIRKQPDVTDLFFVHPRHGWLAPGGEEYLCLPTKRSVRDPLAPYIRGEPLDHFVDAILQEDLGLAADDYVLEQELPCVTQEMVSPVHHEPTLYAIYPVDVWVQPAQREPLAERTGGCWVDCASALAHPRMSPTSRAVFAFLQDKGAAMLARHPDAPTMDGLALKWLARNRGGARYLPRETLDRILDAGSRAFNLRVADPYLRYQLQGQGFTWSFFTDKHYQDIHVHGAPVVEIYGVLDGRMEIWWKPYYDRGTSAWCHQVLGPGDWIEVDALQCHLVHWLGPGKGVVFKAGPGPLVGVGRLGEKGKTPCTECPCMKPPEVVGLERKLSGKG